MRAKRVHGMHSRTPYNRTSHKHSLRSESTCKLVPPKKYPLPGCDARQAERTPPRQPPPLLLAPVGDKTVALAFDGGRLSAAAGLVLLQESEDPRGLTRALAAVLADARAVRRL